MKLTIPKLAMSMTEATIAEWLVPDNSAVEIGQVIYTIESDKSTQEIEAPVAGQLVQVGKVGETYPVGTEIGSID
jgi:pyruvate/2-oxoglutarate dehydrogenase complex dihydrolipoamide acyltransferase (E2) component